MAESIIGKRIVLKSNSEIRYIGTLYAIDRESSAISLVDVLSLGTEDRVTPGGFVPPANTVYPYVVFRAADVRDIAVIDEPGQGVQPPQPQLPHDPAIVSQGSAPAPPMTQAQSSPFPPNQSPAQHVPSPHASSASIVPPPATMAPPIAPSVATAHTTTLERVQNDFSKRPPMPASSSPAVPSRQPTGPAVGIPFEQLAAQVDHRGPPARGPGRMPHHSGTGGRGGGGRTGGASRGPGAFSLAAQGDDLKAEFDFEGMNARFAALRSGEKGSGGEEGAPPPLPPSQGAAGEKNVPTGNADQRPAPAAETVPSSIEKNDDDKTTDNVPKAPAYNKSSSFFDSVSSNIQNPQQSGASRGGRGRGGGGGGFTSSAGNRGRGPRTHNQPFTGGSFPVDGGQPRGAQREGASAFPLPPRPPRGGGGGGAGRFNNRRRDEAALNEMTFGGDDGAPAPPTTSMDGGRGGRARGRGNGRPATAATTSFE